MRNPLRFPRLEFGPEGISIRSAVLVTLLPLFASGLMAGCTPALDWREVRLADSGLSLLFPCKPQSQTRAVDVAGLPWSASLTACEAGGLTFAAMVLSPTSGPSATPPNPPDRQALLGDLARDAGGRWGPAQADQGPPAGVRLPEALGQQARWARHLKSVQGAAPVATQGLFLVTPQGLAQLSVHGQHLGEAALEGFFGQLRVSP